MMSLQNRPKGSHLHLARLLAADTIDPSILQAVWSASQDVDDPSSRPREGWWSVVDWASTVRPLTMNGEVIGLAAVEVSNGDVAEGRLALVADRRTRSAARALVNAALAIARSGGAERLRHVIPTQAIWAGDAVREAGFEAARATHVMLRPATAGPMAFPNVDGVDVRPLRSGEDSALLAALNRAWAGTWGFSPIPPDALAGDLRGQRDGMLVATDAGDDSRIVATVHAIFDFDARNLDGGPSAWISNLTTDPDWRGRGLGRLMLARGIGSLLERGAESVMLGVDGGNEAAVGLYQSSGFEIVSTTDIWERSLEGLE
jgi:ribosomal protein S18 acetylase RimI-like enzyme